MSDAEIPFQDLGSTEIWMPRVLSYLSTISFWPLRAFQIFWRQHAKRVEMEVVGPILLTGKIYK